MQTQQNLMPIPRFDMKPDKALPFDLFVRLPVSSKVILYRHAGSIVDKEEIHRAQDKKLALFVAKDQFAKYIEFASNELLTLLRTVPLDTKQLTQFSAEVLSSPIDAETTEEAKELLDSMSDMVVGLIHGFQAEGFQTRQKLFEKFGTLARNGTDFQKKPLHAAAISLMLAAGLGINDQRTLLELGLAGLLHDLGLSQVPLSVVQEGHRYKELGVVSKSLLKEHPKHTLQILEMKKVPVSKLMESMILQHHEEWGGDGYPQGLRGDKVHPMAQILHLADDLNEVIMRGDAGRPVAEAVRNLLDRYELEQVISPELLARCKALLI